MLHDNKSRYVYKIVFLYLISLFLRSLDGNETTMMGADILQRHCRALALSRS